MENNDNLNDFFNKKLNEFDDPNSTWDKPDIDVREAVLANITTPIAPVFGYVKLAWIGGIAASLLLVGGYIYSLKSGVNDLELALQQERERVEVLEQEIAILSEKESTEIAKLELKNSELTALNDSFSEKENELENIVNQINEKNKLLYKKINLLQKKSIIQKNNDAGNYVLKESSISNSTLTETKNIPTFASKEKTEIATIQRENNAAIFTKNIPSISQKQILKPTMKLANTSAFIPINNLHKKENKFEIAYTYTLQGMTVPIMRKFDKQDFVDDDFRAKNIYTSFYGLMAGYEVRPNWWIRAGVQVGRSRVEQDKKFALRYDDSDEYMEMGELANNFLLTSSNPYTETNNELQVSIPEDELENGELFEIYLSDYQRLKHFKFPVSAEYHYGEGRLKWVLSGGLQLNRVVFGDYRLKAIVKGRTQDLYNRDAEIPAERFASKHFLGANVGIGMNYKFSEKIYAQIGLNYQYDVIKSRIKRSNSVMVGTALSLGLNYRI